MTAFNCVRFRVKPGRDDDFVDAHRQVGPAQWPGLRRADIIRIGEHRYCLIAQWESAEALAAARPQMIATLDTFRDCLEDQGDRVGLTDAVSGPVVLSLT